MKNLTTKEFYQRYNPLPGERKFASHYATMRDCYQALLDGKAGIDSALMAIEICDREGVTDERTQRRLAVRFARRIQHLMNDPRSIAALDMTERYIKGEITVVKLADTWYAAGNSYNEAWQERDADIIKREDKKITSLRQISADIVDNIGQSVRSVARMAAWDAITGSLRNAAYDTVFAATLAVTGKKERAEAWADAWAGHLQKLREIGNIFDDDMETAIIHSEKV